MKQTVGLYDFRDAFNNIRPNNFSYEGLEVLFDYFEQYEIDTGYEVELDVIAICCEFSERDVDELISEYDLIDEDDDTELDDDEKLELVTDYLNDKTMVCGVTPQNTVVYQDF